MSDTEPGRLTRDDVYHLLSNPRRRFIISYLQDHSPIHLQELAAAVAAWENDTTPEELTDQQQKRVYVSIYQTHIPKLEDAGVITYDSDDGVVHLQNRVKQLNRYLPGETDEEQDWRRINLLVAVGGLIIYSLVVFDVPPFGTFPDAIAGVLVLLAVVAVVTIQYVRERGQVTVQESGFERFRQD